MTGAGSGAGKYPSLGVVVPVYNEATTIESGLREIGAVAKRYPGEARVIAVDDGSVDGSADILARLRDSIGIELEIHPRNLGYGAALRTGLARAEALGLGYVAFIDSDLTNPPEDLLRIGELARDGADYIKASRFIAGGRMEGVPRSRRAVSIAGNLLARTLFATGVKDVTNGFRAGRTELLSAWPLEETGFAVIVEELDWALHAGVEPVEFPTVLHARGRGQRPSAFAYSPAQILSYLRYPLRAAVRRLRRSGRRPA